MTDTKTEMNITSEQLTKYEMFGLTEKYFFHSWLNKAAQMYHLNSFEILIAVNRMWKLLYRDLIQ